MVKLSKVSKYKREIPALNLSIEKDTDSVPLDGQFHLLHKGKIVFSHSQLKKVEAKYHEIIAGSGYRGNNSTPLSKEEMLCRLISDNVSHFSIGTRPKVTKKNKTRTFG